MARETSDFKVPSKAAAPEADGGKAERGADLNAVPSANRLHIGFFGRRNAGKSSVVNRITGQALAIVSDVKGTTTDPVQKAMELLPLGPVVVIDTPGIDDSGLVGEKRVEKSYEMLSKTDVAVLVIDSSLGYGPEDLAMMAEFRRRKIPFVVARNKADLAAGPAAASSAAAAAPSSTADQGADQSTGRAAAAVEAGAASTIGPTNTEDFPVVVVSALTGRGIDELKETIARLGQPLAQTRQIIGDRIHRGEIIILVTPIDASAPKGRMILPQVQTIRDILDTNAICMVTQVPELEKCLSALSAPPALVITDSQAFGQVKEILPPTVKLTSFSVLFARFKGILDTAVDGVHHLDTLRDGDRILISEGCTHHRQCEDIGTVKLPAWIEGYTGKKLCFDFTSGGEFPRKEEILRQYALIVHCGGCMLNEREMASRMESAVSAGVPFTNYGTLIAQINGILQRSLEIFA